MYPDLEGKIAVVTGSSSGLGYAIAERFLKEGMKVVINNHSDSSRERAEGLAAKYNNDDKTVATVVQGDVSKEEDVVKLHDAAVNTFGDIHVWVNNAGMELKHPTHEVPLEEWEKQISVNLTGVFLGTKHAIKHFLYADYPGAVINLSSVHEKIPWPTFAAYTASKGGVSLFSQTAALEYAHKGIRVNCIAPGAIETPINAEKFDDPKQRKQTEDMIPMHVLGQPEQVSAAAAWLASDEANYVTGHSLFVDGGMTLYTDFEKGNG